MEITASQLASLKQEQEKMNQVFKPVFYRLNNPGDEKQFDELLATPGLIVADHFLEQVVDLVKFKNPSKLFSPAELEQAAMQHINGDLLKYGVWVYYPWVNRVVHMLDKEEFIDVRTSRNQNKITRKERDILAQKKIGVIGLSVGQSVSVTLAMERICGQIRLADFDLLELTNLNRIRTGIHNLGLPKVYSVAREISEIDPFIDVICFPEGLTEANMDEFFLGNGKLDLLVEESDGFDIKILSRYKARELQIPVIMEASDRCAVDVERFDLHPQRSILHGIVDHLDIPTLKSLKTNDEKIPYMIEMLGLETASLKLKASMLEIGQSINTWPQLASAVTMGGGITADISRRMLLNQYTQSGRFHVDIEELISDPKPHHTHSEPLAIELPAAKELAQLSFIKEPSELVLSKTEVDQLVTAGSLAPSTGNNQPWRWVYEKGALLLFNAMESQPDFLDYESLSSLTSLGAAVENVRLQAGQMQLEAIPQFFPEAGIKQPVVIFQFSKAKEENKHRNQLASFIPGRVTNRKLGLRQNIEQTLLDNLSKAAQETKGAGLHFFTNAAELDAIGDLLGEIEKIRLLEKEGHHSFVSELRWTREQAEKQRDGMDLRTFDYTNTELMSLRVARSWPIMELINTWNGGNAFKRLTKKSIDAAGAVGIITMSSDTRESRLLGGMAAERVWLEAGLHGLALQPLCSSVFLYNRLLKGKGEALSDSGARKLQELRPAFEKAFLIQKNSVEIFIFRLTKAAEPAIKSLRRPPEEISYYK